MFCQYSFSHFLLFKDIFVLLPPDAAAVDSFFRASYVYTFGNVIPFLCKLDYLCFFLSTTILSDFNFSIVTFSQESS